MAQKLSSCLGRPVYWKAYGDFLGAFVWFSVIPFTLLHAWRPLSTAPLWLHWGRRWGACSGDSQYWGKWGFYSKVSSAFFALLLKLDCLFHQRKGPGKKQAGGCREKGEEVAKSTEARATARRITSPRQQLGGQKAQGQRAEPRRLRSGKPVEAWGGGSLGGGPAGGRSTGVSASAPGWSAGSPGDPQRMACRARASGPEEATNLSLPGTATEAVLVLPFRCLMWMSARALTYSKALSLESPARLNIFQIAMPGEFCLFGSFIKICKITWYGGGVS